MLSKLPQAPTLVLVGRHDNITPVFFAEEIAKGVQDATLRIFEKSGHSPQSDEPETFRAVLRNFLNTKFFVR